MKPLAHIGIIDKTITYRDRPTVKVVVKKGDTVLILNKGLLPGGGIDEGEAHFNLEWLTVDEALVTTTNSSREAALKPMIDDVNQGKYYNFMTTRWILNKLQSKPHPTAS